jgi:hypothetical protein
MKTEIKQLSLLQIIFYCNMSLVYLANSLIEKAALQKVS